MEKIFHILSEIGAFTYPIPNLPEGADFHNHIKVKIYQQQVNGHLLIM